MLGIKQCNGRAVVIPCATHRLFGGPVQRNMGSCLSSPTRFVSSKPKKDFVCSSEANAGGGTPSSTGVVDYVLGQGMYQFLTVAYAAFAVGLIGAAPLLAEKFYVISLIPATELIFRGIGAMTIPTAIVCYCMQNAIAESRENEPMYKRLSFTLAVSLILAMGIRLWSVYTGVDASSLSVWSAAALQFLPTIAFLKLYGVSTLGDIIPGIMSGVTSLFKPETITAGVYSVFTAATMILGLSEFAVPQRMTSWVFTFPTDAYTRIAAMTFGAMMILVSITCFTLKEAADENQLGSTISKTLNAGLSLTALSKVTSSWYVCEMASQAAKKAGSETVCMMTTAGGLTSMGVFLFLALYSGFYAIMAKKEE